MKAPLVRPIIRSDTWGYLDQWFVHVRESIEENSGCQFTEQDALMFESLAEQVREKIALSERGRKAAEASLKLKYQRVKS